MSHLASALASALSDLSVRHVFGMPGGATLPLIDAFDQHGISFVLTRHEGSAGFMADAVSQLTGDIGVCVSTLGPGATNLVSGIAQAYLERSRVLGLIGLCDESIEAIYTHQIISHHSLFSSICGHYQRLNPNQPETQLRTALRHLTHGAPSPVILELSRRTALTKCDPISPDAPPLSSIPNPQAFIERLQRAERPVIFVGCGDLSTETSHEIRRISAALSIPVLTTYRAKGMVPENGLWALGAAGLSPVVDNIQQRILAQCDLLVGIGLDPVELRPNWLPGWSNDIPFIGLSPFGQIDLTCPIEIELRGSVSAILEAVPSLSGASLWVPQDVEAHRGLVDAIFKDSDTGPATAIRAIQSAAPEGVIACLDVGAHRITASHVWQCDKPRHLIQSNGFSSMGVGLPYAIAARLCYPDTPVVTLTGDMGLWMCMGELGIVQERELDMVVVYLSDASLSLIELKQEREELPQSGVRFRNPDVMSLAAAFGGHGRTVQGHENISVAVAEAFEVGGLWLIEALINPQPYRQQM